MANISTAHGSYTFNFANVKANNEKKVAWIKEFAKLTSEPYYETYFYDAESLTSVSVEGDEITLPFVGSGHWSYRNNIYWFEGGGAELKEIVLRMDGIKIDIDYKEYEPGGMFVSKGSYTVEVKGGEVSIIERSYERDDLNENTFVDWDFGTIDEYKEILSRGEEANFAAALLMPKELVYKTWQKTQRIRDFAEAMGVSQGAAAIRLIGLNLID